MDPATSPAEIGGRGPFNKRKLRVLCSETIEPSNTHLAPKISDSRPCVIDLANFEYVVVLLVRAGQRLPPKARASHE